MLKKSKQFICSCFYSRNIFIRKYKLHVSYQDDNQFFNDYRQNLRMKGCSTTQQYEDVLKEIQDEISRRRCVHVNALKRRETIFQNYPRLHSFLWTFNSIFIDEKLLQITDACKENVTIRSMEDVISEYGGRVHESRLYQFPVFSQTFCQHLVEELSNFENNPCPKGRPNTMNKYGVSLDELGLSDDLLTELIIRYIRPISGIVFDDWGGQYLDSFKAFVVMYGPGKDTELSLHYDNAEVTLNVCLTTDFDGGSLEFGSLWGEEAPSSATTIQHRVGTGILHRGRQMHKALPTTGGLRSNLIIWMRSSVIRNQCCPMCEEEPSLVEVPYDGDGFVPHDNPAASTCVSS